MKMEIYARGIAAAGNAIVVATKEFELPIFISEGIKLEFPNGICGIVDKPPSYNIDRSVLKVSVVVCRGEVDQLIADGWGLLQSQRGGAEARGVCV